MKEDKEIYNSEDWQRTMEVPAVGSAKKEPAGGIYDPWHLNSGGPSESILDSIAKSLREADSMPEMLIISDKSEEEIIPQTTSQQEEYKKESEQVAEIEPQPEIKPDDTIVVQTVSEEKEEKVADVQATMVVPRVLKEGKPVDTEATVVIPATTTEDKDDLDATTVVPMIEVTPKENKQKQEIVRQKTTGGRLWPPVLMSSIFMIIACIITLTVGIMPVLMEHGVARGMTQIMSPVINAGEPLAYTNVLLVGVDKDGYRTDTMMVATYDINQDKAYIMQLPRDTYVHNNGRRDKKLNSAYYSGLDQLKREVQMAYGIQIHKYVEVNLDAFRLMIDAIGGVEMNVPINMIYDDPYQDFHIYILKGNQVLNGKKAEQFVRFRQNNDGSGYPRGDLQRMEAQREFIMATVKQMISLESLSNIDDLIKIAQENLKTDLTFDEIYNYCTAVLTAENDAVEFVNTPGEAANLPGGSYFVVDYDGAREIAQNYFYATQATMAKMKKIVVQPVQAEPQQPETNSNENRPPQSSSAARSEENDKPSPPRDSSSSTAARRDEGVPRPSGENSGSGAMSR